MNTHWSSTDYCARGKVRPVNEDSIMTNNTEQLWVVADGMGGHANGDYASQYVTNTLRGFRSSSTTATDVSNVDQHLTRCNTHLITKAKQEKKEVIGCTVAALLLQQEQAWCIWSGDSRIYRLRDSQLSLLTRDHNFASLSTEQEGINGDSATVTDTYTHGEVLTSAIGGDPALQTELCCYTIQADDEFFLCTDGLYREITDTEISAALDSADSARNPVETLAALYQSRGAHDNVGMIHIFSKDTVGGTR